jgi:5-methylcytosine-specific restriction enzyme A
MMSKELSKAIRDGNLMKFYNSKEWRKKRLEALSRDHNECQNCKDRGKVTTIDNTKKFKDKRKDSLHVHHIKELTERPDLALELNNLKTVCRNCHNEEHERLEKVRTKPKFVNEERW